MGMRKYEIFLLTQYARYSVQYLPHFHNSLDWVASAQHFGLPTRLLDWSQDPFVALYFSCFFNKEPQDSHYYLIVADRTKNLYCENIPNFYPDSSYTATTNVEILNSYKVLVDSILSATHGVFSYTYRDEPRKNFCKWYQDNLLEEVKQKEYKLFFCTINDSNPRIIAQKGLFQLPRRFVNSKNEDCIADDIFNSSKTLYKIECNCRDEIINYLDSINITTPRLFPDLQNICNYISNIDTFPNL